MKAIDAAAAYLKVLLLSRRPSPKGGPKQGAIVVMGNGPSLRQTIDNRREWLMSHSRLAVNFAANAPEFFGLRPDYYVLADPHFFRGAGTDPNVASLWRHISAADWPMTLYIPVKEGRKLPVMLAALGVELPENITIKRFNLTPGDGATAPLRLLYSAGLAMPRPRNVLIPSIMTAMREGFRKIYLCGADHTWTRTLEVDEDNHVVSVQPHFYKDSGSELKRVSTEYKGLRLCDVLGSMTIAFRSYFDIRSYAQKKGVEIVNSTPGSFIDAFPREKV